MLNEQEHFKDKIKALPVSFIRRYNIALCFTKNDTNGVASL